MKSLIDVCKIREGYRELFETASEPNIQDLIEVLKVNLIGTCNHEDNRRIIDGILSEMIERFQIRKFPKYEVYCTKEMNPPELIDQNKICLRVVLKDPLEIQDMILGA